MENKNNVEFDLRNQYLQYLQRIGLVEAIMHPEQKLQVQDAFMGGCFTTIMLFKDRIGDMEEQEAVDVLNDIWKQCGDYWLKRTNQKS